MKEKIKNEYAVKNGFDDWDDLLCNALPDFWRFAINEVMDIFVNQEVERRIAERMPSEEEQDKWADYCAGNTTSDHNKAVLYKAALSLGATWLRSRLSQKTEGGGE